MHTKPLRDAADPTRQISEINTTEPVQTKLWANSDKLIDVESRANATESDQDKPTTGNTNPHRAEDLADGGRSVLAQSYTSKKNP